MNGPTRPKFFKAAAAEPLEGGFALLLDGKPVKTPKARALVAPTRALAEALAAEWNALEDKIEPAALPLTRLVNTVLDGTSENRALILEDLRRYATGDLLCYRAEGPEPLIAREAALWDPLLAWAKATLGADLRVTAGIVHRPQDPDAVTALSMATARLDDLTLTAVHLATGLTGSLVLGLALAAGRVSADEAFAAATVDEAYQAELWGIDAEAKARADRHREDLQTAERLLRLVGA
jgi:chaperone required for assembly of F1-ATPase